MHKSILDPSFVYRDSASTDVRATFNRAKNEATDKACDPWFDASAFVRPALNVRPILRCKQA